MKNELDGLYHHMKGVLLHNSRNKKKLASYINTLKNTLDLGGLYKTLEFANRIPAVTRESKGILFPRNIEDIGSSMHLYKPKSIENEINWILFALNENYGRIELYLLLKKDFEHSFLLGDYKKAEEVLDIIKKELGYSIWYIEAKFLLLEYLNKSEEQKLFLSEINQKNSKGLINSLLYFLSQRTERNFSAYKYDYDLRTIFSKKRNIENKDVNNYYLFRLNFFEHYLQDDLSSVLVFENYNSLIDRYNQLIFILQALYLNGKNNEIVFSRSRYLYRKTKDTHFIPLIMAGNPSSVEVKQYFNNEYIKIIDLFYSGLYDDVIYECRKYILNDSRFFDVLIFYCQSLISTNKTFVDITKDSNSLINQICRRIYNYFTNIGYRNDHIYNLYQKNKNIYSFDFAYGLDFFLRKEDLKGASKKMKSLSFPAYDPYMSNIYDKKGDALTFIEKGLSFYPGSISLKYFKGLLTNEIAENLSISPEMQAIGKARILYNQDNFEEAYSAWINILTNFNGNNPVKQTALKYAFSSLVFLKKYDDAIVLYVNNFISDPNTVYGIETEALLKTLRGIRYKGVIRSIELVLFVCLASNDDTEKSFILEQFCLIYGVEKPSELTMSLSESADKIENFFFICCTQEILKHSIYISNTIDRLRERQLILSYLIENYPENRSVFLEEQNLITNEVIVYEGTQKLDESKIYANDQAIINQELRDIDGLFSRFKTIYNIFMKDKKIVLISEKQFTFFSYNADDSYNESDVKYTDSAILEVFSELFDIILEKFLFSKFGIVAYLSTRIRHGVLLGELRPEIDKQNLILNKIKNTKDYESTKYWSKSYFRLSSDTLQKLNEILKKFSLSVDNLIEEIIKQRIQIKKNGENEKGLFNYEYSKNELYEMAIQLGMGDDDPKIFCQNVIDRIWLRTDVNLENIRLFLDRDVRDKFAVLLNELESDLKKSNLNDLPPEIFTNINECSTILENKIGKISSWFRRSGSKLEDFDIDKLFNIVWDNTAKCYPKVRAECDIQIESNPIIKAAYYIHFVDLFRIFLDNIFKYGKAQPNGVNYFNFSSREEDGFLICLFKNLKPDNFQDFPLEDENILNVSKLISEGKSGIFKALKIVKYDLNNEKNTIQYDSEDSVNFSIEISIEMAKLR